MTPAENWARCKHWIEAALAHLLGLEAIEDVERAIERGSYQVWFGKACCAVTEIADYARVRALMVVYGGGDMAEMRTDLRGEMAEMRTDLRGEIKQLGTELRGEMREMHADLVEKMRDMQTEVLRAFHGWAAAVEIRLRVLPTLDERLGHLEERVAAIERREIGPRQ